MSTRICGFSKNFPGGQTPGKTASSWDKTSPMGSVMTSPAARSRHRGFDEGQSVPTEIVEQVPPQATHSGGAAHDQQIRLRDSVHRAVDNQVIQGLLIEHPRPAWMTLPQSHRGTLWCGGCDRDRRIFHIFRSNSGRCQKVAHRTCCCQRPDEVRRCSGSPLPAASLRSPILPAFCGRRWALRQGKAFSLGKSEKFFGIAFIKRMA